MLTLTIRPGDKIMVGDTIVLEVRRISGGRLSLGVAAPGSVVRRVPAAKECEAEVEQQHHI